MTGNTLPAKVTCGAEEADEEEKDMVKCSGGGL